jgi:hypothetical protein
MDEESQVPEAKSKPSQVPSWVTLGFALGALFVMALPKPAPIERVEQAPPEPAAFKAAVPSRVTTIEAVFSDWGRYAQWSGAVTQVGLWNADTRSYSDFYEVLKMGDVLFFRSIPALSGPVVSQGIPVECPLEFAQSIRADPAEIQKKANLGALSKSIRETFGPTELPKPASAK